MKPRTILIAIALVGAFVYLTTTDNWLTRRGGESAAPSGPIWSGPGVAFSAGVDSDEQNNIEIYKAANEAIVNITSTVLQRDFFFRVFPSRESGSGFFVNEDGLILTNNHVISGQAPQVQVTLADQSSYEASILARDRSNDLALVKIDPDGRVPYLRLGDSDAIQVGQKVLAIGNPFGLNGTLTTGIISSLGRTIQDENGTQLEDMVQTDAAINPGNSGGPLLDSAGNVIGVNTAIYGPSGNIGIGFAMPINTAKRMLEDYRAGRSFGQPFLGINYFRVSGALAEAINLPREGGALIYQVVPGSPAARAGLRGSQRVVILNNQEVPIGGDLILSIDGEAITADDSLGRLLGRHRPGDSIEIEIFRDGQRMTITATVGSADG